MDIKRIALILALAGVAYALVVQWNTDYGIASNKAQQSTAASSLQNQSLPPLPEETAALSTQKSETIASDIPPTQEESKAPVLAEESAAQTHKYIRVKTDTLDILINPRGGDVEYTALLKHLKSHEGSNENFVFLEKNKERTYVAQSGLIGKNGIDNRTEGRPLYQSVQATYVLANEQNTLDVRLTYAVDGVEFNKIFHFNRGSYLVEVEYVVDNKSGMPWQGNLFAQIKRDGSEIIDASKVPMGVSPFLGAAYWTAEKPYNKYSLSDFHEQPVKLVEQGGWVAFLQHYFVNAWVAPKDMSNTFTSRVTEHGEYIIGFTSPAITVLPGQQQSLKTALYSGPKDQDVLQQISPGLDLTVDYGWLWFIGQPIFKFMHFIHGFVGNWGLAIIILTLCIKLLFFPLSAASYRSMANMRRVQPEMARLKELHGDDRQKMSQAMMELYRKEKVNPLGGCLPILVQMPVFISLYWVILESVELRHAKLIFWINDLSVMDPYFVLPIIMGVTMFIQQGLNPTPPDPIQAKVMKMMPIAFTFMFMWFPSGLVLYWIVNNILSIIQQYVITKNIEKAHAAPASK